MNYIIIKLILKYKTDILELYYFIFGIKSNDKSPKFEVCEFDSEQRPAAY